MNKKIAIISDIHANMQALQAVLADIKSKNCTDIFCLGDIALGGPQPVETTNFVMSQNWTIIQGNTDFYIANYTQEVYDFINSKFPVMSYAIEDDVKLMNEAQKKFLRELPAQKEIEISKTKILLVHGSPRNNSEDIAPNMPLEKIEEIISGTNADIIFCGHTHTPCGYQTNTKQTVVNVGSVGRPMTSNAMPCYAILEFSDDGFNIEHNFVDYDRFTAEKVLAERDFKGAKELSKLLIEPISRHL